MGIRCRALSDRASRSRVLGAVAAIAAAGACSFDGGNGGGGGCGGTPGEMGRAVFNFEQAAAEDLSDQSGNAFASGTTARFKVVPAGEEDLPPYAVASGDASTFAVDDEGIPDYPLRLTFGRPGVATLEVSTLDAGVVLDEVDLRVAEPRALRLASGHRQSPSFDGGGLVGEPSRIVLAPGASCRLFSHLTDGSDLVLYGTFVPAAEGATIVSFADDGMLPLSLVGQAVHAAQTVTALGEGTQSVTLAGPNGLRRRIEFEVAASPDVARAELALWPGYQSEWEVGESTFLVAAGRAADDSPVYGYPVEFAASDPSVVSVRRDADEPDVARLDFLAAGAATITARFAANPEASGTVAVTVVPVTPDR